MKSKKAKALVLGLVLKREGISIDDLKKAFRGQMTRQQLTRSLKSLQDEGRISQAESAQTGPTYVPADLLDRIQDSVTRASIESEADAAEGRRLPSSLLEALKERRKAVY